MTDPRSVDETLDIAIVGAGVSGVYCGWRLLTAAAEAGVLPPRVAIFDGATRVGGRLLSVEPPGVPGTRVELGGMRYTSSQVRVNSLLARLAIKSAPFPVSEPQNIAYLRGRRLRVRDLTSPDLLPYRLRDDERTQAALNEGFTALAAQRTLRLMLGKDTNLTDVDWRELARTVRYEGRWLRDLPLRFLIGRAVSQEAYRFAYDSSGYDSILETWNSADGFPWNLSDFGKSVTYSHVQSGYDTLPKTLAELFGSAGGKLHLGHRLISCDRAVLGDGAPGVRMVFAEAGGATYALLARKLILAMPRRSLELLEQRGSVFGIDEGNHEIHELIGSVTPIPLFKLAICYPYPWWQTIDPIETTTNTGPRPAIITKGQSITDLPLRQCYYWAVDPTTQNAVLLIYDDGSDLDYWAGLRSRFAGPTFEGTASAGAGGPIRTEWFEHQAPAAMVREVHRQLLEMHGVADRIDIPQPYAAAYRDWGEDPYGGGANFWHLHIDSREVARRILQPKPPIPVFICGEAYSHNQGWVEGALETADQLLELYFGLPQPAQIERADTGASRSGAG